MICTTMEALTNTSLTSSPAFSIPVLNHCVGGQSWWTRSRSRSCGGDASTLVALLRCRPKASGNHQSANLSFLFPSPPSSILSKGSNTDLAAATFSRTAAACKYNGRRCSMILTASSSSSSPKPLGEEPEEDEGKNGEEVERALGMDGSIPSSSEEFLRLVSSPAYDMRRHLFQTINSSSYEGLVGCFSLLLLLLCRDGKKETLHTLRVWRSHITVPSEQPVQDGWRSHLQFFFKQAVDALILAYARSGVPRKTK